MKAKGATHTRWGHHDTMIVNLRDWVTREINALRNDISTEVPELSSSTSKMLKSAEDMNVQLFELVRSVANLAEKSAKKKPTKAKEEPETVDESFEE